MVLRRSRPPPAARRPQWCLRDNSKTTGWIVLKFVIHIGSHSVLTWLTFQGRRSKVKVTASENDVIFSTFLNFHFLSHFPPKPSWGGHSNTPSNSAPLPLFCPSVYPSVCPSIGLLTTFSGFCTFADKSLGRNGIELEMQMFPDDLSLANIDADGYCCHFMRSSVRPTIHGLGFVSACPTICFFGFFFLFFSKVRFGAKEGGSHYWEMAVAITCGYGGYLLPLLAAHSSGLMAPSHFLNQCCLITNEVRWSCGNDMRAVSQEMPKISISDKCLKMTN